MKIDLFIWLLTADQFNPLQSNLVNYDDLKTQECPLSLAVNVNHKTFHTSKHTGYCFFFLSAAGTKTTLKIKPVLSR